MEEKLHVPEPKLIKKPYVYYRNNPVVDFSGEKGRTKQQFLKECDINRIVNSAKKTGVFDHLSKHNAVYADVLAIDFQESLNTVMAAQDAFDNLPSEVRNRFENNPSLFLDFAQNPQSQDEMVKMGLLPKPLPIETPITTSPASGDSVSPSPSFGDDTPTA